VDSFSTDETLAIVKAAPQSRVVQRRFDSFAGQCNFGLQSVRTEWVLSLDADYVLSEQFNSEIAQLIPPGAWPAIAPDSFTAFMAGRCAPRCIRREPSFIARPARATRTRPRPSRQIDGQIVPLTSAIFHDDRKPLERWFPSSCATRPRKPGIWRQRR